MMMLITIAVAVMSNSGPAGRRRSEPLWRSNNRKPTYATPAPSPNSVPRAGSVP